MKRDALERTVALGTITGMRAMSGVATLAYQHGGLVRDAFAVLAASEMFADKTAFVGDRIAPGPLAGRALLGAAVGAAVAYEDRDNPLVGGLLGAGVAVAAAHLAFHARKRLPLPNAFSGLIEDAVVMGLAAHAARLR